MQMTTDARAWLASTVRRLLARHPLAEAERAGITYELMSHLHAAGEARASAAGRSEVMREDLEIALIEAGGDEGLAAAFVQPLATPVERVPLGPRLVAFAIDALLLGIVITFLHGLLETYLGPLFGGPVHGAHTPSAWWQLLPWGYHDPALPVALQVIIALASVATVLGYFTWSESYAGRSLGKRALALRVVRVDGRPPDGRAAVIRNLVKLTPLLLIIDVLCMLIVFSSDRQRLSDKLAATIVVRASAS